MTEFRVPDFRLTTAEILYRLPDFPDLLQTYVWQNLDVAPAFPKLHGFLDFWRCNLEGRLYSVRVTSAGLLSRRELRHANYELRLQ